MASVYGSGVFASLLVSYCIIQFAQSEAYTCGSYQKAGPDFPDLDVIKAKSTPSQQEEAALGLIKRILPDRYKEFSVKVVGADCLAPADRDAFVLSSTDSGLSITASSGYAAAWGFHYYLKHSCGGMVSWGGRQVNVPRPLPRLDKEVKVTSNDRFRYYQNVVTVSYSFAWHDWKGWEREIDWMALNGMNLPLAFNGQEAIWQRVYLKMGVTQQELDAHFGGPAFLAWGRMGNLRGWGGPLPDSWHRQQVALQHQILDRMRAFGMTPVLPAFAGHVPAGLTRVFPNASISRLGTWGHMNETYTQTYLLDSQDPLFPKVGKAFLDEYIKEFGTDHVYNCDTFNENQPTSSDPSYLAAAGSAVYNGMKVADPNAIWVMQGWLFVHNTEFWHSAQSKALLTSVPLGKMIVLDLAAEINPQYPRLQSFFGQPFIWCMLHNFGGNVPMYGKINSINEGPFQGRAFKNSTMIGLGVTPEGVYQNEFIYEFFNENSWRQSARNLTEWVTDYTTRRYAKPNKYASDAWQLLKESVYNCPDPHEDHAKDVIISNRPRLDEPMMPSVWYDPADVFKAWHLLLEASDSLPPSVLFRYDLVDVTRQSLQLIAIKYYTDLITHYKSKDQKQMLKSGDELLGLLNDVETVLAADEHFLLGAWIESAKALATNDAERKLYEFNARNQVTLWGPQGNIRDYAKKQWSGLVKSFYYKRWAAFVDALNSSLAKGEGFDRETYNNNTFTYIEYPFTLDRTPYPTTPAGDSIAISKRLYQKYTTSMTSPFYSLLKNFTSKGKRFIKTATGWNKKYLRKRMRMMKQNMAMSYEWGDYDPPKQYL